MAIGVVAFLGLVVALQFCVRGKGDPRDLTRERMATIEDALDRYVVDNGGVPPSTGQGLRALLQEPEERPAPRNWCGPYLEDHRTIFDGCNDPCLVRIKRLLGILSINHWQKRIRMIMNKLPE